MDVPLGIQLPFFCQFLEWKLCKVASELTLFETLQTFLLKIEFSKWQRWLYFGYFCNFTTYTFKFTPNYPVMDSSGVLLLSYKIIFTLKIN